MFCWNVHENQIGPLCLSSGKALRAILGLQDLNASAGQQIAQNAPAVFVIFRHQKLGIDVALVQPSAYSTRAWANIQLPTDSDRVAAYGALGEIPDVMFKRFMTSFQAADAPNPHDVAQAIAKLVAQPKGSRAARTVVGPAFGADAVNEQTAPIQAHVVEALGLGHLAKVGGVLTKVG